MLGRYDVLARSPAVRADMNNVRFRLARKNPRGYSAPMRILCGEESFIADVLPLYFASSVVRDQLVKLDERPEDAELVIEGFVPVAAVRIALAYADGSSRAQNWAADLDTQPNLAAYVWDFARAWKIQGLEKLVRDAAFDQNTGSLCPDTAPRLVIGAKNTLPDLYDIAHRYICYNLEFCSVASEFALLPYPDIKSIITAQRLRATQVQRYRAIFAWYQSRPKEELETRETHLYALLGKLHYALTDDEDVLVYQDWANDALIASGRMPPAKPVKDLQLDYACFVAFDISPMISAAVARAGEVFPDEPSPRFLGQFKAFNYYFQLEVPWYDADDVACGPCMGAYLRLLHGSDLAGLSVRGEVVGILVMFRIRLHNSANFAKSFVCTEVYNVDMMNLPGRRVMHGCRVLVNRKVCKLIMKHVKKTGSRTRWHASVEIRRVKELPKPDAY